MRRTVIDCDKCGKETTACVVRISAAVGRSLDGAGSYETDTDDAEYCPSCASSIFSKALDTSGYDTAKQFFLNNKRTS